MQHAVKFEPDSEKGYGNQWITKGLWLMASIWLLQKPFLGRVAKAQRLKATLNNPVGWLPHAGPRPSWALRQPSLLCLPSPPAVLHRSAASCLGSESHARKGGLWWERGACHLCHPPSPWPHPQGNSNLKYRRTLWINKWRWGLQSSMQTFSKPSPSQRQPGSSLSAMHLTNAARGPLERATHSNQSPLSRGEPALGSPRPAGSKERKAFSHSSALFSPFVFCLPFFSLPTPLLPPISLLWKMEMTAYFH